MNSEVKAKYDSYPDHVRGHLLALRDLVYEVARERDITDLEEALKWGEPSFLSKKGSTLRIDWKAKTPQRYYLFFNCKTKLVETFRELYKDQLQFEGKRAIVLHIGEEPPKEIIKNCISLTLRYKLVKHMDMLGE